MGVIYKDLKPENVMYDPKTQRTTLIDFGSSCKQDSPNRQEFSGTVAYMAPEMIQPSNKADSMLNSKVDCWSFGVFMYELLSGKSMFNQEIS